jgi:hypothetical protein
MGVGGRGGAACVVMPVSKASLFPVGTDRRDRETTARLIQAQAPLLTASVPGLLAISAPTGFHEGDRGLKYCHAVPVAAEPLRTASRSMSTSIVRRFCVKSLQWAVEHGLQIAAEALFDVGSHILAGEFQESVDEYRDIPERLRARAVLSEATARRLDGLASSFTSMPTWIFGGSTPASTDWLISMRSLPTSMAGSPG